MAPAAAAVVALVTAAGATVAATLLVPELLVVCNTNVFYVVSTWNRQDLLIKIGLSIYKRICVWGKGQISWINYIVHT